MSRLNERGRIQGLVVVLSLSLFAIAGASAQTSASYGQQIAVAKSLKPGLTTLGVFGSNLSDKTIEQISRAGR